MNEFPPVEAAELAPQRLRRRALELLDDALSRLDRFQGDDPKIVHDLRRRFKELRALAHMAADALPHGGRRERALFRDAGRCFGAQRDAKATVEAFDRLREHFASEWTPRQFLKIRRALATQIVLPPDPVALANLRMQLADERSRIAGWPIDFMTVRDLRIAFARSYRSSRRAMRAALRDGTADKFHAWRRQAKTLWYQAQMAELLGMGAFESRIKALHKLSRVLGNHHDLVIIDDLCQRSPERFGSPRYVRRFRSFLVRRMRDLEKDAESIGDELFAQRPREWAGLEAARQRRIGPKRSASRPAARSAISACSYDHAARGTSSKTVSAPSRAV